MTGYRFLKRTLKDYEDFDKYILQKCHVKPYSTLVVPEGIIVYYSDVKVEGDLVIDGVLKVM